MREISARNQLAGTVTNVTIDGVTAEVTIDVGNGNEITAVITRSSVERLGLREGVQAIAVMEATDMLIGTDTDEQGGAS